MRARQPTERRPAHRLGRSPVYVPGGVSPLNWHAAAAAFGLVLLAELGDNYAVDVMTMSW